MKKLITSLFALFIINTSYGQGHFSVGSNLIGVGIGLGSSLGSGYTSTTQSPAISLQYEHGIWDVGGPGVISLGGFVGLKSFKNEYDNSGYSASEKWSYTVIGVRGVYHLNSINSDKFDVYGGAMLSYDILSYTYTNSDPSFHYVSSGAYGSTAYLSLFIGGRYYFNENFAAFAELGYGVAFLNIGLAYKF